MARRKYAEKTKAQGPSKNAPSQAEDKSSDTPKPSEELEDGEWEVEAILAIKKMWRNLWVRAAWVGYGEDPAWYPVSDFKTSPHLLVEFYENHPSTPGPPTQLVAWLEAWEAGDDYDHLKSDKPMDPRSRAKFFQELAAEEVQSDE